MDHPDHEEVYTALDFLFTTIFAMEMLLKILHSRIQYFKDGWNLLDFVLAWLSILDSFILGPAIGGDEQDLRAYSVLRILRILRLIRAIRLLRMFRELWKIVKGIIDSLRTIFWAGLLLILVLYVCGIFCCAMIGKNKTAGYYSSTEEEEVTDFEFNVYQYYGTVPRAMFTLFETCIEPLNIRPVIERQPYMLLFFSVFIFLTTFGVLNVIIGVIVDHTMAVSPEIRRAEAIEALRLEMIQVNSVRAACTASDEDADGMVTPQDIEKAMRMQNMSRILENMELPLGITHDELFHLLDSGGDGAVTTEQMNKVLMRAVVQSDHQQLLELKIHCHATQSFVRRSVTDLERQMGSLTANVKEMKNDFQNGMNKLGSAIEEIHSHLLKDGGVPSLGPRRPHSFAQIASPVGDETAEIRDRDSRKVTFSCVPFQSNSSMSNAVAIEEISNEIVCTENEKPENEKPPQENSSLDMEWS
eukprot:gnl/MRDRNA2_/MRDRNA2_27442_c0_seq1.p1 gnl/MRDRNA2_/MRDRNA2_27442_c0~~gnl/MRDRNA2_/MRDRNA2_27442_c0_seq1.p1  ORF type:complete len:541 (+),score=92.68 gnl/MRDRNA2_/MRDRNA2_27442_c0_seq1:208-1623(+)